jgi:DNA-binding NarL/FixJ family response regulator
MSELTLLCIHDDEDTRHLITQSVKRRFPDAHFVETRDAAEGIAFAVRHAPTAAVVCCSLDARPPTILHRLREACPGLPILYSGDSLSREEALRAGASGYHDPDNQLRIADTLATLLRT